MKELTALLLFPAFVFSRSLIGTIRSAHTLNFKTIFNLWLTKIGCEVAKEQKLRWTLFLAVVIGASAVGVYIIEFSRMSMASPDRLYIMAIIFNFLMYGFVVMFKKVNFYADLWETFFVFLVRISIVMVAFRTEYFFYWNELFLVSLMASLLMIYENQVLKLDLMPQGLNRDLLENLFIYSSLMPLFYILEKSSLYFSSEISKYFFYCALVLGICLLAAFSKKQRPFGFKVKILQEYKLTIVSLFLFYAYFFIQK